MRLSIFLNENRDSGKVLVFKGSSMEELFASAASKLCSGEEKLVKACLADGAEVDAVEEIQNGDKLYFTRASPPTWQATAQEKVLSAANTGIEYWSAYSSMLMEKLPALMVSTDTVQQAAGQVGPQVKQWFDQTGATTKLWTDEKIAAATKLAQEQSAAFLASDTGQSVNGLLMNRVIKPAEVFYSVSMQQLQTLRDQSEEKKVSVEAFLEGMKAKLGDHWSDKLVEPTKAFYDSAMTEYKRINDMSTEDKKTAVVAGATAVVAGATAKTAEAVVVATVKTEEAKEQAAAVFATVQTQLGTKYDAALDSVITSPVAVPATFFYQSAYDSFKTLEASAAESKVSTDEFVGAMKIKLGSLWTDQLKNATSQLYGQFSKKADAVAETEAADIKEVEEVVTGEVKVD